VSGLTLVPRTLCVRPATGYKLYRVFVDDSNAENRGSIAWDTAATPMTWAAPLRITLPQVHVWQPKHQDEVLSDMCRVHSQGAKLSLLVP